MAKGYTPSTEVHIPSLQQKQEVFTDPMRPGSGTPWEDRGASGTIVAFFKTCLMSLSRPRALLAGIRRPDTRGDATPFAIGCGLLWGVSSLINNYLLFLWYQRDTRYTIDGSYWTNSLVQFVLVCLLPLVFLHIYTVLFAKLANAGDMKRRVPNSVLFNIFAYCLGPSLLALIPVAGPPLAVVWIVVLLILAANTRLNIKMAGAIVNTMMVLVTAAVVGSLVYYLGGKVAPSAIELKPVTPPVVGRPV